MRDLSAGAGASGKVQVVVLSYFITGFTVKTSGAIPMRGETLYPVQRRAAVGCVRESSTGPQPSLRKPSLPCASAYLDLASGLNEWSMWSMCRCSCMEWGDVPPPLHSASGGTDVEHLPMLVQGEA